MKSNSMIMIILVAVVVGAGAFFGGMKYQESQAPANSGGQQNTNRGGANATGRTGRGNGTGIRPVTGNILSIDNGSITVKMQDGSSKIVLLPGSVTISKTDAAAMSDLKVGELVGVFGTPNSDGSVTAQNVQLNPMFRNASGSGIPRPSN